MPRCPRSTAGSARPEPGCSQRRRRHVAPRRSHPASPSAHPTPCALGQSGDRPRCPRFAPGSPDGARSRRMRHRPAFGTPADRRLIGGEPGIDGVEIAIPDVSITGRQPQHALAGRRRADKNRRPLRTRTARAQLAVLWQRADIFSGRCGRNVTERVDAGCLRFLIARKHSLQRERGFPNIREPALFSLNARLRALVITPGGSSPDRSAGSSTLSRAA
jgi:hypothetical protein